MSYVVAAVVAGIAVGYLRGGRFSSLAHARIRWWPALVAAVVLQVGALVSDGTPGIALLFASFALVITFTAMNLTRPGMGLVLVGVAMNAIVIGVNSGMPVREGAIVASGLADRDEVDELEFNSKWHLESDHDRLTILGDIIPVPGAREVLSFGDLVMAVGVADVIVHLMRSGARTRSRGEAASPDSG